MRSDNFKRLIVLVCVCAFEVVAAMPLRASTIASGFQGTTRHVSVDGDDSLYDGLGPVPTTTPGAGGKLLGPKKTIQAAVDDAVDGDVVSVGEGEFSGVQWSWLGNTTVYIEKKRVYLRGAGKGKTVVFGQKGSGAGRCLTIHAATCDGTLVEGITFRDGETDASVVDTYQNGGAVYGNNGTTYFVDCEFRDCVANRYGGAVFGAGAVLVRCLFSDNLSKLADGGSAASGSVRGAYNCVFVRNGDMAYANSVLNACMTPGTSAGCPVVNCTFFGNLVDGTSIAAGLNVVSGAALVENSLFNGNLLGASKAGACAEDMVVAANARAVVRYTLFGSETSVLRQDGGTLDLGAGVLYGDAKLVTDAETFRAGAKVTGEVPRSGWTLPAATVRAAYNVHFRGGSGYVDEVTREKVRVYRVAKNLRTTATGTEDPEGESSGQDYVFPATEFFHDAGTFMLGGTRTITISNYVWRGGTIHTMQGSNPTLAGKMRIAESSATRTIRGWATQTLTIESDISGTGLITLDNVSTSSACAITELAGDNTDFTGTFLLNNRWSSPSLSKYVQCGSRRTSRPPGATSAARSPSRTSAPSSCATTASSTSLTT